MRNLLLSMLLLISCSSHKNNELVYRVEVWDMNYSMANTSFYCVTNDSLLIKSISSIEGEGEKILMAKKLTNSEGDRLSAFLISLNLDSLKENYVNELIEDGDRKKVRLVVGDKTKVIEISNSYQKDIGKLFKVINSLIGSELAIKYRE